MWSFAPIAQYPKVAEKPDWAERILSDSHIVEGYQLVPRHYDEPFLYSYGVGIKYDETHGPRPSKENAGGVSFDHSVALMKAAGEAAERFSLLRGAQVGFSSGRFRDESPGLRPEQFRFFSPEQIATDDFQCFAWDDDSTFLWTTGSDLLTGESVKIPAQLAYMYLKEVRQAVDQSIFPGTSTGAACGRSLEDSSLSAILELLERDAFMVHYLSRTQGIRVDLRSSMLFSEIEEYLRRFRLTLQVYLLQTDFPVCPVLALVTDEGQDGSPSPWMASGLKCSLDSTRAVLGAIEEACQTRLWLRSTLLNLHRNGGVPTDEMLSDVIVDRALYWNKPERAKDLAFLTQSTRVIPFDEIALPSVNSPEQGLQMLLNHCSAKGHSVYRADITAPEVRSHGLVVSRVVMPTLQQFYLTEPYLPLGSSRWKTVPYQLGLCETVSAQPNPIPHFFL